MAERKQKKLHRCNWFRWVSTNSGTGSLTVASHTAVCHRVRQAEVEISEPALCQLSIADNGDEVDVGRFRSDGQRDDKSIALVARTVEACTVDTTSGNTAVKARFTTRLALAHAYPMGWHAEQAHATYFHHPAGLLLGVSGWVAHVLVQQQGSDLAADTSVPLLSVKEHQPRRA
eukprot:333892-Rhodomonas_salina.1